MYIHYTYVMHSACTIHRKNGRSDTLSVVSVYVHAPVLAYFYISGSQARVFKLFTSLGPANFISNISHIMGSLVFEALNSSTEEYWETVLTMVASRR